jgi:hypothetical protein
MTNKICQNTSFIPKDIATSIATCPKPCTDLTYHPTVVTYETRDQEMAYACGGYGWNMVQLILNHNAEYQKVKLGPKNRTHGKYIVGRLRNDRGNTAVKLGRSFGAMAGIFTPGCWGSGIYRA